MQNQQQISNSIQQFCEQFRFKCITLRAGAKLALYSGQNGKWQVILDTGNSSNNTCFLCFSLLPTNVPPAKQTVAMEYLTRANYGLAIGNFEMDVSVGEVRYKTSLDLADGKLTPGMVAALVLRNLFTTDRYLKGLQLVLFAEMEPATAIQVVEATLDFEEPDEKDLSDLLDDVNLDRLSDGDD